MDAQDRERLRAALLERHPWLADPDVGPSAVVAGECDLCGTEPRLVQPCGPAPAAAGNRRLGQDWALGRRCAAELGVDGWCAGHADEAAAALAALAGLPPETDAAARLWWVANGEVRVDPELLGPLRRLALGG